MGDNGRVPEQAKTTKPPEHLRSATNGPYSDDRRDSTVVRGPLYGSMVLLGLTMLVPIGLGTAAAAWAGWMAWPGVPGASIGILVLAWLLHKRSVVEVGPDGVVLTQPGLRVSALWGNVAGVHEGVLGAQLRLRDSQRIGAFKRRKLVVAFLDPFWRHRAVGRAILARIDRQAGRQP